MSLMAPEPLRRNREEALGPPPTLRRWPAGSRGDEPAAFESIESGVDRPQEHRPSACDFDLLGDLDAVGLLAAPENGQEDHEFEVREEASWHIFTKYEVFSPRAQVGARRVDLPHGPSCARGC